MTIYVHQYTDAPFLVITYWDMAKSGEFVLHVFIKFLKMHWKLE